MVKSLKVIGVCITGVVVLIFSQELSFILSNFATISQELSTFVWCVSYIVIVIFSLGLLNKYVLKESQYISNFPFKKNILKWIAIGVFLPVSLDLLVIFLTKGSWSYNFTNNVTLIFSTLFGVAIPAGVCEELIFRGFMFNYINKKYGIVLACLLPSVIFALIHIINGGLSLLGIFMLVIAGTAVGIMFSCIKIATGNIWYGIVVHILWDFLCFDQQNTIVTLQNTPAFDESIISYKIFNPSLFSTGGDYGIETSIIAILIYLSVSVILINMYIRNKEL